MYKPLLKYYFFWDPKGECRRGEKTTGPLYLRIFNPHQKGTRTKNKALGIELAENQWDKDKQLIKNHPNAISLNKRLRKLLEELREFENDISDRGEMPMLEDLDEFWGESKTIYVVDFMERELELEDLKEGTKRQQRGIINRIKKKWPKLKFNNIDLTIC